MSPPPHVSLALLLSVVFSASFAIFSELNAGEEGLDLSSGLLGVEGVGSRARLLLEATGGVVARGGGVVARGGGVVARAGAACVRGGGVPARVVLPDFGPFPAVALLLDWASLPDFLSISLRNKEAPFPLRACFDLLDTGEPFAATPDLLDAGEPFAAGPDLLDAAEHCAAGPVSGYTFRGLLRLAAFVSLDFDLTRLTIGAPAPAACPDSLDGGDAGETLDTIFDFFAIGLLDTEPTTPFLRLAPFVAPPFLEKRIFTNGPQVPAARPYIRQCYGCVHDNERAGGRLTTCSLPQLPCVLFLGWILCLSVRFSEMHLNEESQKKKSK